MVRQPIFLVRTSRTYWHVQIQILPQETEDMMIKIIVCSPPCQGSSTDYIFPLFSLFSVIIYWLIVCFFQTCHNRLQLVSIFPFSDCLNYSPLSCSNTHTHTHTHTHTFTHRLPCTFFLCFQVARLCSVFGFPPIMCLSCNFFPFCVLSGLTCYV